MKGWESRAAAVAAADMPLDLTVYFSGNPRTEVLAPHVRLRQLAPVFSTKNLAFLPYVPDHTDLAPYHFALAKELPNFDVIHTTDAYFAFARTAEHISKKHGIPLTTSFHTDTPSYTRIFTENTIRTLFGSSCLSRFLIDDCHFPHRQEQKMIRRLKAHLSCCAEAFWVRHEDAALAREILKNEHTHYLSAVSDKNRFNPARADRTSVEAEYRIPPGQFLILFVGRLDIGKNIYTLIEAMELLIEHNVPVHLLTAGLGPAAQDLENRLGSHVTVAGFIEPDSLARLMASSDVLAVPSEIEIRGLVPVEALASGLPVLVSEKSGIESLLRAEGALKPVSGGAGAWASSLEAMALDRQKLSKMRERAIEYANLSIASWDDIMRKEFFPVWWKAYAEKRQAAQAISN